MLSDQEIAEGLKLCEAATPGSVRLITEVGAAWMCLEVTSGPAQGRIIGEAISESLSDQEDKANGVRMAWLLNNGPAALTELQAIRAAIRDLEAELRREAVDAEKSRMTVKTVSGGKYWRNYGATCTNHAIRLATLLEPR